MQTVLDRSNWDFADYLQHWRGQRTQTDIAGQIGVSQRAISHWLMREYVPGPEGWAWLYAEYPEVVGDEGLLARTRARVMQGRSTASAVA